MMMSLIQEEEAVLNHNILVENDGSNIFVQKTRVPSKVENWIDTSEYDPASLRLVIQRRRMNNWTLRVTMEIVPKAPCPPDWPIFPIIFGRDVSSRRLDLLIVGFALAIDFVLPRG